MAKVGELVSRSALLAQYRRLNRDVLKQQSRDDLELLFLETIMKDARTWSLPRLRLMTDLQTLISAKSNGG